MNPRQLIALWIGIALACLLLLFPPQMMMPSMPTLMGAIQAQFSGSRQAAPVPVERYDFLFTPPRGSVGIDWPRVLLPLAAVFFVTLGAVATLQTRRLAVSEA